MSEKPQHSLTKEWFVIFSAASAIIPFLIIFFLFSQISEKDETIQELNQEISQYQERNYTERQTEDLQKIVAMLALCDKPSYLANETFTSTELNKEYDFTVHSAKITMHEEDLYNISVIFSFKNKSINPISIEAGYNLFLLDERGRVIEDSFGYIEDGEYTRLSGSLDPGCAYDHVKVNFSTNYKTNTVYLIFSDTLLALGSLVPNDFLLNKDDLSEIAENTVRYQIKVE